MMQSYISLTEKSSNRWVLAVKLPIKWLRQFTGNKTPVVCNNPLSEWWGEPVYEDGQPQPWRQMTHDCGPLADAEKYAAGVMEEIRGAVESLRPRGYIRYVLDLGGAGDLIKEEERNVPEEDRPF